MRTYNYTDFRKNLNKCLDSVVVDCDSLVINRGDKSVVVISLEEYSSMMETIHIMASPATVADIARSRKEIQDGEGIAIDSETL